jgi:uncharacterized protein with ParB-like and HNH nuclease domain
MAGFQSPITISQAIEKISNNEYLLPAFQREFVWSSDQIEQLFDSLMRGYPINSMLFWKVKGDTKTDFHFYQFLRKYIETYGTHNDTVATNGKNDFYAILDGQQRLTSLFIGLYGSYAYHEYRKSWEYSENSFPTRHLYLNISSLYNDEESDQRYKFSFKNKSITKEHEIYIDENKEKWFKIGIILNLYHNDSLDEFVEKYNISKESRKILRRLEKVIFTEFLINYYEEEEQDPDKAVSIFIRINDGGTKLDFSDLLMSTAISCWKKKDARYEILSLVDTINAKGFNITKDYILKSFLFLYHKDIRFCGVSFNSKFIGGIEKEWENIRNAILSLFDLLRTFGLNNYTLTANNATLPILYYIYHNNLFKNFSTKIEYKKNREIIRMWLLSILVRHVFGGQGDSVLTQCRRAFTKDIDKEKIQSFKLFPSEKINKEIKKLTDVGDDYIEELLRIQKGAQYSFSILALLYPDMDYKNNNFNQDHLHPESAFDSLKKSDKEKYGWEIYNSILNLQMLDENENKSKQDMDLKTWVENFTKNTDIKRFMDSHIIPQNIDLSLNNFGEFIDKRKKLLMEKLKEILN